MADKHPHRDFAKTRVYTLPTPGSPMFLHPDLEKLIKLFIQEKQLDRITKHTVLAY